MRFTIDQIASLPPAIRKQVEAELARPRGAAAKAVSHLSHATSLPNPPSDAHKPSKRARSARKARVKRTRNGGTWTEARYWQTVRSGLRRIFRFWKPAVAALHAARVPCAGKHGQKWGYVCADCRKVFPRKRVQIDHIEPVGTLLNSSDVGEFLVKLTPEDPARFAVRCKPCHQAKTNKERKPL